MIYMFLVVFDVYVIPPNRSSYRFEFCNNRQLISLSMAGCHKYLNNSQSNNGDHMRLSQYSFDLMH